MDHQVQQNNVSFLQKALRRQQLINIGVGVFCALLFFSYVSAKGDRTEVLVPTQLSQAASIKGRHMDQAYLEEIGLDLAPLFLTVNPRTLEGTNTQRLLRIAHPASHAKLTHRLEINAEKLRRDNASQVFWPDQVLADPENNRVAIFGVLSTYINDKKTSDSTKVYVIELAWSGSRVWLSEFDEGLLDDPFRLKPENQKKASPDATSTVSTS